MRLDASAVLHQCPMDWSNIASTKCQLEIYTDSERYSFSLFILHTYIII